MKLTIFIELMMKKLVSRNPNFFEGEEEGADSMDASVVVEYRTWTTIGEISIADVDKKVNVFVEEILTGRSILRARFGSATRSSDGGGRGRGRAVGKEDIPGTNNAPMGAQLQCIHCSIANCVRSTRSRGKILPDPIKITTDKWCWNKEISAWWGQNWDFVLQTDAYSYSKISIL